MKNLLTRTLFVSLLLLAAIPSGVQANISALLAESRLELLAYRAGERLVEAYDNSAVLRRVAVPVVAAVGGVAIGAADARLSGDGAIALVKFVAFSYGALAIENGHNPFKRTK